MSHEEHSHSEQEEGSGFEDSSELDEHSDVEANPSQAMEGYLS